MLLASWLNHSRTLRLSVLERVGDQRSWDELVEFIKRYGSELFTQRFFSLGNVRAILHQGVGKWLRRLQDEGHGDYELSLLEDLGDRITYQAVEDHLSLCWKRSSRIMGNIATTTVPRRSRIVVRCSTCCSTSYGCAREYDRVCWHLKPVIWAHEILVSRKQAKAARLWRRALTERIADEAEQYLVRLKQLQQDYAIRMSTVADRLAERFVRPMAIDRMRALVKPAMDEACRPGPKRAFELLEHETELLARESTGIGFDVPVWLLALEEEVDRAREPTHRRNFEREIAEAVPCVTLSRTQVRNELEECSEK